MDLNQPFHEEHLRLERVRGLGLVDGVVDTVLDGLVRCAAGVTACPVALLSMIDAERQVVVARVGSALRESLRDLAFCAYTVLGNDPFVVEDASDDTRFADDPAVRGATGVRFYAGAPVAVAGVRVGALCVIDTRPRHLAAVERLALTHLAMTVSSWLDQRDQSRRAADARPHGHRPRTPIEVSLNHSGGFHLSLRAR